jgi:hypothetical protein
MVHQLEDLIGLKRADGVPVTVPMLALAPKALRLEPFNRFVRRVMLVVQVAEPPGQLIDVDSYAVIIHGTPPRSSPIPLRSGQDEFYQLDEKRNPKRAMFLNSSSMTI